VHISVDTSKPVTQDQTDRPPRIAITGASGLIGSALTRYLKANGFDVVQVHHSKSFGETDQSIFEGLLGVINLAGENLAGSRWTQERKDRIYRSRVDSTLRLCQTLASLTETPDFLISASGVGYYGDCGDKELTENDGPGKGFLSDLCVHWEEACNPARDAGIRVVNIRMGVVISSRGGALPKMLRPYKYGVGGPIGKGRQYMSWIDIDDLIKAIGFLIAFEPIRGPVNLTSPYPVQNKDFSHSLGLSMRRSSGFPLPSWVISMMFGEMGRETILMSQRAVPRKLLNAGFKWGYPFIGSSLKKELGS
jgi:uncharacterized protein